MFSGCSYGAECETKDCRNAKKLITQFKAKADDYGMNIPSAKLLELNGKLALGILQGQDLPASIQRGGQLKAQSAHLTLNELNEIC